MKHVRLLAWTVCVGLTFAGSALTQSPGRTAAEDDVFWESVSGCTDALEVELYIAEFGEEGRHVAEARACLERLGKATPAVARKKTPSAEIERLLGMCEAHLVANRLTTGVGGTAVQCYLEVLSRDPANMEAESGLRRVFDKYAAWAHAALERGDAVKARDHAEKLKGLNPEAPEVAELEGMIARFEKQATQEQAEQEPKEREAPVHPEAEDKPVHWKMASAFGSGLIPLGSLGKSMVDNLDRVSGGNIKIEFFEPGALIPPLGCFDAVAAASADACWSSPGHWYSKEPALAMFAAVPFGPRAGEYLGWIFYGGGYELWDAIYEPHGLKPIPCGIVAPDASGWFRKEVNSIEDLAGLKMRIFGQGARVMEKVGVSIVALPGSEIFPALERGVVDAIEFSMPAIDRNFGFYRVAKHYYFPGWHQQSALLELLLNRAAWDALSGTQQAQIEVVCGDTMRQGLAEGEAIQGKALAELKDKGVQFHRWPPEVLDVLEEKWREVAAGIAARDANFKRVWASYTAFRSEYAVWKELGYLD